MSMALLLAVMTGSCTDTGGSSLYSGFHVFSDTLFFPTEGAGQTVTFRSPGDWHAEYPDSIRWFTVYPAQGKAGTVQLSVTADENTTMLERSAQVWLVSDDGRLPLVLQQMQNNAIAVDSTFVTVTADGGPLDISVKANVDYAYSIEPGALAWLHSSESKAVKHSIVSLYADANESFTPRTGRVMLTDGDITQTVTIRQDGVKAFISTAMDDYTVDCGPGTVKVELTANVPFSIRMPDADWLRRNTAVPDSSGTQFFHVSENATGTERSAQIVFYNDTHHLERTVTVTQAQNDVLAISASEFRVDSDGGDIDVTLTANVGVQVESEEDWITLVGGDSKAVTDTKVTLRIAPNVLERDRQGLVHFTSGTLKRTLTVRQGAAAYIRLERDTLKLLAGHTAQLKYTTNDTRSINWTSDADAVAGVDSRGVVTARTKGTALVVAGLDGTAVRDTCRVIVTDITGFITARVHRGAKVNEGGSSETIDFTVSNGSPLDVFLKTFTVYNDETGDTYLTLNGGTMLGTLSGGASRSVTISARPVDFRVRYLWTYTFAGLEYRLEGVFE